MHEFYQLNMNDIAKGNPDIFVIESFFMLKFNFPCNQHKNIKGEKDLISMMETVFTQAEFAVGSRKY